MSRAARSIVLHGHFYQPPREDPWTGRVPRQPSAAPFHDWNERVTAECYAPIVRCPVLADEDGPDRRLNALEWMSFDFGPTLLHWLEREAPDTYRAVLDADRASVERSGGHGNAMAMPYHHPILPLSSPRDRTTEIRWGLADFRTRFGRRPEGMWLPETAVDDPTLDALAAEGVLFTVVAPHQVDEAPPDGRPGRYVTQSGREIALFVYDGRLSHAVAFGDLLRDGVAWAEAMVGEEDPPLLRSVATDGETFGHHHEFGEMGLAKAIDRLRSRDDVRLESFASFLAREGTGPRVRLVAPTAWSCAHGVERWRSDCGCRADTMRTSSQAWRAPLRSALEWLADGVHDLFAQEGRALFGDPWAVRDAYGAVVARGSRGRTSPGGDAEAAAGDTPPGAEAFVRARVTSEASELDVARGVELLEMERNALRSFTSCAWFFDDVAGIEPRQVLAYARRALELAGPPGERLVPGVVERLRAAESNDPEVGTAADLFLVDRTLLLEPTPPRAAPIAAGERSEPDTGDPRSDAGAGVP